jgi:uncharacterized protein YyaL (SSP411 family)
VSLPLARARALWHKRLHRPEALRVIAGDLAGRRGRVGDTAAHLAAAADWILRAQRATPDGGVAAAYSFEDGWVPSYAETTGYIIPTLLGYAERTGDARYRDRALEMAEWELAVQYPEGGFPGHFADRRNPPIVFNTGQILFGLVAAHEATGDERFLAAARRAGDWLVSVQDADGAWRRFDYRGAVHSYNTRSAWALVELGLHAGAPVYVKAGEKNLDWSVDQQQPNGWYRECAFTPGRDPFLHTIAYASQGLLEAGLRLERPDYIAAARRTCDAVQARVRRDGWIAGTFDGEWRPTARYSCLTGNAQMAIQWFKLAALTGNETYRATARRVNGLLKALQDRRSAHPGIRGGIKGSHPVWGRYLFGTFPNWAAKFFMDALLAEEGDAAGKALSVRAW